MKITKLSDTAIVPTRSHEGDAGLDLYANLPDAVSVSPFGVIKVPTGIAMAIPTGHFGQINDRSSMGLKGWKVMGGVVDSTYTGEIQVILQNMSPTTRVLMPKDKIAQIIIIPIATPELELVDQLEATDRGDKGFGSTGT